MENVILKKQLERLQKITEGCRPDMHEPDSQGVTAQVPGWRLDNSWGSDPYNNYGEFAVRISREGENRKFEWFNLADLIALARMAKIP